MTVFLETERLILKKTGLFDFDYLFALQAEPDVMEYTGHGKPQVKEEAQKVLESILSYREKHGYSMCSVFEKEDSAFIGQAGLFHIGFLEEQLEIELSYRLHKKFWGKGYGTEISKALIQWGFDHLPITKLVALVHPDNIASHRILQKCGMINLGIVNSYYGELVKYEIYKDDSIELAPYNTDWTDLATSEIKKLHQALPVEHILDIQHVGSTAIPGIKAKPIIDIQIAVDSLLAIKQTTIDNLKSLKYEYWHDNPDPERMFFVKGMPPFGDKRTHHLHIVELTSRHWQEKIQFRDYLLSHPEVAQEYEKLKIQLANQYPYDREKYTDTKTQFIHDILQKANTAFTTNKK